MRALVTRLIATGQREKVLVTDWPEPKGPTGSQIKTRTLYSGITNGTERNDLLGGNYAHPDDALPAGWGYQNVGRVIEVGRDVRQIKVGDVLFMSADHMEYVVMPEAGLVVRLPASIDPTHAALSGMASVAMHSCRNADLRVGERVLIVGQGCIGQFAAQIAALMGARVHACEIDPQRLEVAHQVAAAEQVFDVSGDGWEEQIEDRAYDAVIDLAGVPGMEDALIRAARTGGRVLFVAGRTQIRYTFNLGQGREITIKQNSHFSRDDLHNVCRLVSRGLVRIAPLVRDVVPLSEAERLYAALRDRPHELLGTVFVW